MTVSAQSAVVQVPLFQPDQDAHRRNIASWAIQVNQGKLNNTGSVTLATGVTTTTVTDARVGIKSFIGLTATTANAAAGVGTLYVSARNKGSFVLTHSNSANADRTFLYAILG